MIGAIFQGIGASIQGVSGIIGTVDSMNNPNRALNIEREKTERARIESEAVKAAVEAKNRKTKVILVISGFGLLVLIVSVILFWSYKRDAAIEMAA